MSEPTPTPANEATEGQSRLTEVFGTGDCLPDEWLDVLVFQRGKWRRGQWYKHNDGTICWTIENTSGHPHLVETPTHWTKLPEVPNVK